MRKRGHEKSLDVFMGGDRVGGLGMSGKGEIWFAYSPEWIDKGFALSPFGMFAPEHGKGALPANAFKPKNGNFDGLHGVFNDSLPDGWGLLLMDRALEERLKWRRTDITPLDRLSYIGNRAMGALEYRPSMEPDDSGMELSLSDLAEAAVQVQKGAAGKILEALRIQGGSPGGARPKVTVALEKEGGACLSGFGVLPDDFEHWLVKFRAEETDPPCIGRLEKAYAEMAGLAGVEMPRTRLMQIKGKGRAKPQDAFAVRRFDREGNGRLHVVTLGGMMDASHRVPCMSYNDLMRAVSFVTKSATEVEKAFRLMLFNILAHNKDDHVKNFAFIRKDSGWSLAPAYDLTFNNGMGGHHMMGLAGSNVPNLSSVKALAESSGVANFDEMLRKVHAAVSEWPRVAEEQGVTRMVARTCDTGIRGVTLRKELDAMYAPKATKVAKRESGQKGCER